MSAGDVAGWGALLSVPGVSDGEGAAAVAALGTEVEYPVGGLYDIEVVFDNND